MIKKLCTLFVVFVLGLSAFAIDKTSSALTRLENGTFGVDYNGDKAQSRIERLEKNIYGKIKSGSIESRITQLNKDIAGEVIGEEIEPCEDTFLSEEDIVKSDGTENYPIINEIEETLFSQATPEISLKERISKIEEKIFKKKYESEDYFDRMERIKSKYYNEYQRTLAQNNESLIDTSEMGSDFIGYRGSEANIPSYYSSSKTRNFERQNSEPYSTYNPQDEYELAILEEKILNNTYPNESVNERLSRLENKVFDTDFFYDDAKIRIDRLSSASKAKRSSSNYDNNQFQSKMNTAMSIGSMLLMILAFVL